MNESCSRECLFNADELFFRENCYIASSKNIDFSEN